MSDEVKAALQCAKCGKDLKKVLPLHSEASKTWLRKHGYDGAEWNEMVENLQRFNYAFLPPPHEGYKGSQWIRFCLCLNCTSRDFKFVGEKVPEEREEE